MYEENDNRHFPAPEMLNSVSTGRRGWGRIFMLGYPGLQIGADGTTFIHPQDLKAVLDTLASQQLKMLTSLPRRCELPDGADLQLQEAAAMRGMKVTHLPVVDFGIPDAEGERSWQLARSNVYELLGSGHSVGFCCLSGIGRSPTFAARVLFELGADQNEAIKSVRLQLPTAIETDEQKKWVGEGRKWEKQND